MGNPYRHNHIGAKGFTLVELIVVITIIGIGLAIASLNFNQWQTKNLVEAQIRQMASDFSEMRIRAMTTKQPHSITLNANNYVFKAYTSSFARYTSVAQQKTLPGGTRSVKFQLVDASNTAYANSVFEIDERGALTTASGFTVFLGGAAAQNGAINCLTLHVLRVNVGKNVGTPGAGVCNDR